MMSRILGWIVEKNSIRVARQDKEVGKFYSHIPVHCYYNIAQVSQLGIYIQTSRHRS
jgi:hypothetical protein